jgi:hypothetical protein
MTVKLALLKSGEDVIADVQEMVFEDKVIGYIFNKPCNIKMKVREEDSETEKVDSVKIRLTPWVILTKETKIPVSINDFISELSTPFNWICIVFAFVAIIYWLRRQKAYTAKAIKDGTIV